MKLFCFPRSGNSREVKLVLAEKGLDYESVNIHARDFNKEDPEFLKASPRGEVPALIDEGAYLAEALDINVYLDKKYPKSPLLPEDKSKREEILNWIREWDKKLTVKIGLYIVECLLKPKPRQSEAAKTKFKDAILQGLKDLDQRLKDRDYVFDHYTLADVAMTPHIAALHRVNIDISPDYPHLTQWLDRIKERSSFQVTSQ